MYLKPKQSPHNVLIWYRYLLEYYKRMKNKYKTSYGIALCRYNKNNNNNPEILLIKKRYTYYYCNFILGHYKKYNNKQLQFLFGNMTFAEKLDILSMNFNNMWYRLWLFDPEKNYEINTAVKHTDYAGNDTSRNLKCYFRKKNKFENIFVRDGGRRLKKLIDGSTNSVAPWEIPKGGKNLDETDLDCAKREFEEETGIYSDKYLILWDIKPVIVSHKDGDTIYKSVYFLATFNPNSTWQPKVRFDTSKQLTELEQVQWISLNEINFLNLNEKSKIRILTTFKKIIYKFKKCVSNTSVYNKSVYNKSVYNTSVYNTSVYNTSVYNNHTEKQPNGAIPCFDKNT
jgi:8-oxo-dGTP pyrophosphatase MutT (NUDIX family)